MTSILKLEALSGVQDDGPLCYLLQVDQVFFLLDCGWDERFDMAYMEAVKRRVPQINAVLLSYADISHLGALPYLVRKCGLTCPIYATVPVYKMGQMFLYDWVIGHNNVEDFQHYNLDDIDASFERVQQVKYSQTVLLKGDNGLQITPLPAGHMIGGSIWRITKMGDEEIVYAVDFNHKRERHLNGCTFEGIGRPNLLITDAYNAIYNQPRRKNRDEELVTKLLSTVRDGGDVLVVIDTAGRVLEIAHLLDQLWHNAEAGLMTYNLVMLSNVASSVIEFAKSQVEWMSDKILKSFDQGRYNPFQFRHVQLCHSMMDLMRVRSPKVVLVSGLDMESGYSRELFLEWCSDSKNMVIVTGRSGERSLGAKLIHMATVTPTQIQSSASRVLKLEIKRRIRLEGTELETYRAKKREQEQEAARQRLENSRRHARMEAAESSDESEDEQLDTTANTTQITTAGVHSAYDIMWKWEQQQRSSFFKQNKKTYPMFPYQEEKTKWDDYGEIIRPEDYTIVESVVPQVDTAILANQAAEGETNGPAVPLVPEEIDIPTKCISYITKLEVLCKLEFIDFEGRSDGESVKKILSQIKPKQLVIVHGSAAGTRHLAQHCQQENIVQGKIFTPRLGEIVDATIESHIYQVKDAELSWLDARISRRKAAGAGGSERSDAQKTAISSHQFDDDEDVEGEPVPGGRMETDEVVPEEETRLSNTEAVSADTFCLEQLALNLIPSHQAVFVNDPKLSDVKQLLMSNGFQAEFSAGVLYINNVASVRRNEAGRFHIEGCASEEYYKIRELIYAQFAIV